MLNEPRQLLWFSAGAASAVATKLVLSENHADEPSFECSMFCQLAEENMGGNSAI